MCVCYGFLPSFPLQPTPFVVEHAFPYAGTLIARPAPEALKVTSLFNPGNVEECWTKISTGEPDSTRVTKGEAGLVAAGALTPATALVQLSYETDVSASVPAAGFTHADTGAANCYVDRNRAVRTLAAVPAGAPLTLDFRLLSPGTVASVPKEALTSVLESLPILYDASIREALGQTA